MAYEPADACLWEILVPTIRNSGKPFRTRHHKVWDGRVRKVSGGLTILTPAKGQWLSKEGELFVERMIPVRVIATRKQRDTIIEITLQHYDQLAVLAYRISDEVVLKHRKEKQ